MTARLLAVALAFVIAGAPVAMTVCEAVCATRAADAMHGGRGERHSCHHAAVSEQMQIAGAPHACGHSDGGDQLGGDAAMKAFAAPIVLVDDIGCMLPLLDGATEVGVGVGTHSPPGSLAHTTQLRI
jgi:hypothetical protein